MRFKNALEAIDWYAHRKSNPGGEMSITEACIEVISGKNIGNGQGWNPNAKDFENGLIAMCDIGKMLVKFPPFLSEMLLIWAVDGEKEKALKHGRKVNYIFRRKRLRQQYNILDRANDQMNNMLFKGQYLRRRYYYAKKFSKAS
jgi:hypothetical protein